MTPTAAMVDAAFWYGVQVGVDWSAIAVLVALLGILIRSATRK